jgi:hypothetical protein
MKNSSSFEIAIYRFSLLMKARNADYGSWLMKERKFTGSKGV